MSSCTTKANPIIQQDHSEAEEFPEILKQSVCVLFFSHGSYITKSNKAYWNESRLLNSSQSPRWLGNILTLVCH